MKTKRCSTCKSHLPLTAFSRKVRRGKVGLQPLCKTCNRAYQKRHYQENKPAYLAKAKIARRAMLERVRPVMLAYLKDHPCQDCGETDPIVLQFDHRDPSKKETEVSALLRSGNSWKRIMREIVKCDVVCANCHTRRTAHQRGWWYLRYASEAELEQHPASTRENEGSNPSGRIRSRSSTGRAPAS